MTIQQLAEQYRLKTSRDACGDAIIKGKHGSVSEHDDGMLSLLFMPDEHNSHPERSWARKWGAVKQACVDAGMTLVQEGDAEGIFVFDPANGEQTKLAIKWARIKTRRKLDPAVAAALADRLAAARASKSASQPAS